MHDIGGATAIGRRSENQDRWTVSADGSWAAVSDGVGGSAGGAEAAELTIGVVVEALVEGAAVEDAFARAHEAVTAAQAAASGVAHMAATLTLARHDGGRRWMVAGAGDSPVFLIDGSARRVLSPHTVAEELVGAGAISIADARTHPGRNSITRAIGHSRSAVPDTVVVDVPPGGTLVLASDGIEVLTDAQVAGVVSASSTAQEAADALVEAALTAGATDNVTVVVVRPDPRSRA